MNHNQLINCKIISTINKAVYKSKKYQDSLANIYNTDPKDYKFDFEEAKKSAIKEFLEELTEELLKE
jgi:hypothetical protein